MTGTISRSVINGKVDVGERLGLDALGRVHHQDCALAGGQAPRDLVGEIDMAGRIDQVQLDTSCAVLRLVVHPNGLGLDRDAALALEIHRVEHLLGHLASARVPVTSRRRSASVDFPWSMWATMQKFRMVC